MAFSLLQLYIFYCKHSVLCIGKGLGLSSDWVTSGAYEPPEGRTVYMFMYIHVIT